MSNSKSNWGFMSWLGDLCHKIEDMLSSLVDDIDDTMTQEISMAATTASPGPRYAPEDPSLPKPSRGLVDAKHVETVSENNDMKKSDIALQNLPVFNDRRRNELCKNAIQNYVSNVRKHEQTISKNNGLNSLAIALRKYPLFDDRKIYRLCENEVKNLASNVRKHVQTVRENNDMKSLAITLQKCSLYDKRRRYGLCENACENSVSNVQKHVQTVSQNNDLKSSDIALQKFPLFDDRRRLCENEIKNAILMALEGNTQSYIGDFTHLSESAQDVVKNTLKNYPVEYTEDMEWEIVNINGEGTF